MRKARDTLQSIAGRAGCRSFRSARARNLITDQRRSFPFGALSATLDHLPRSGG